MNATRTSASQITGRAATIFVITWLMFYYAGTPGNSAGSVTFLGGYAFLALMIAF